MTHPRDQEIVALRAAGMTYDAIGRRFGVSRERVRQIIRRRGGVTVMEAHAVERHRRQHEHDRLVADVEIAVREGRCTTYEEVEDVFELTAAEARKAASPFSRSVLARSDESQRRWTHEEILAALRKAATYHYPLARSRYQALLNTGEVDGPSAARVDQVMGWARACELAGVECPPAPRDNYQSNWTDADLWHFVRAYIDARGPAAPFHGYDAWRVSHAADAPSSATLRNRLGRWTDVRRKALLNTVGASEGETGDR